MSAPAQISIRSRLIGSVVTFLLGFAVANVGLIVIPRPDTWLWVGVAVVMMLTGVAGVLFADTRRDLSIWSLLGAELFVCFTVAPLLWAVSTATAEPGAPRSTLWPNDANWSAFGEVWEAGPIRSGIGTSIVIGLIATALAMAAALPAAVALSHRSPRGERWWYAAVVAALVIPTFILAAPGAAQLLDFGAATSRPAMAIPTLAVALPVAIWLTARAWRRAPWTLLDSIRADGGSWWQRIRHFVVPYLALDAALVAVVVFFWTTADFAMGAGLAPTDELRPLSAVLFDLGLDPDSSRKIAAAGLWWLIPLVGLSALFSRRMVSWLGRN